MVASFGTICKFYGEDYVIYCFVGNKTRLTFHKKQEQYNPLKIHKY